MTLRHPNYDTDADFADEDKRTPNRPAEPREPATAAGPFCPRCGHEPHDERNDPRCPEYVAANWGPSGPDPEHCGCTDVDALYVRMREAEARAATPPALDRQRLWDALKTTLREIQWWMYFGKDDSHPPKRTLDDPWTDALAEDLSKFLMRRLSAQATEETV